jgi:phosphate transport system permease protein
MNVLQIARAEQRDSAAQTASSKTGDGEFRHNLPGRHRRGRIWLTIFQASTLIGIVALTALLYNILNSAFGYVAVQNSISPTELVQWAAADGLVTSADLELADLPQEALVSILQANVSKGLFRRFENDQPFAERSQENVYELVLERVVEPQVVETWSLYDSWFKRRSVRVQAAEKYPEAELEFVSWLTPRFITSPQSSDPEKAGVRTAILGSLWTIGITLVFAFPLGVGAAIYLEEYATDSWINRIIQTNINNLAGVPSIIYGMLGLAIFVRVLEPLSSGTLLGLTDPTTANGRTIFSAGLTLGLLILPLIIINSQEAIRAVSNALRQASYGLGATKWQTIWHHVLPNALPGILTGTILAISRAIGETAPLVVVGASTFITVDPNGPFSKFTTLPIQIYQWTARPQDEFRNIAAAAILVLLVLLLTLNASAVLMRNRFSRRV